MRILILIILFLISLNSFGQIRLKQMEKSSDSLMIPVTDTNKYQQYRYLSDVFSDTETDPLFAADSAKILHWSDTLLTKGIASQYDLTLLSASSAWDSLYNGNRAISRVPAIGTNMNATTFRQWLDWWYIGDYTQPSISLGSLTSPREVGTSNVYTLSGSTSNPCTFTLSNGTVNGNNFGSNTSYSYSYTHAPTSHGTTTITAQQSWDETGTICADSAPNTGTTSASRSIVNIYPVFYGMSATSYTSGSVPYTEFTKLVVTEASLSNLTMTGTNMYIYILIPKSWSDYTVNTIIDHNGFNVTSSFTGYDVSITSTGLTNNWTYNYKCYKLNNLTTASGYNYTYNR